MKSLNKLLLASAIALASSASFAMEAMDESDLAVATGQDGIDIFASLNISGGTLTYTDTDGVLPATTPPYINSGDLVMNGLAINNGTVGQGATVKIAIDVGGAATDAGMLQATITGTSALRASLTSVQVRKTGGAALADVIMFTGGAGITLASGYKLNLQLANSPQGHLGVLTGNLGTITIGANTANEIKIIDASNSNSGTSTYAGIGLGQLTVTGANLGSGATANDQTNIDACNGVTVTATCLASEPGLKISFGTGAMSAVGVTMSKVSLGNVSATGASPAIGNISLSGLNLGGTSLRIVGH